MGMYAIENISKNRRLWNVGARDPSSSVGGLWGKGFHCWIVYDMYHTSIILVTCRIKFGFA